MANTIEDFERAIEEFRVNSIRNARNALRDVVRDMGKVVKQHTPVRTGRTRRSIAEYVGTDEGRVYVRDREVFNWIFAVERRHHMFRHGQAFGNRVIQSRIAAAIRQAGENAFRQ